MLTGSCLNRISDSPFESRRMFLDTLDGRGVMQQAFNSVHS